MVFLVHVPSTRPIDAQRLRYWLTNDVQSTNNPKGAAYKAAPLSLKKINLFQNPPDFVRFFYQFVKGFVILILQYVMYVLKLMDMLLQHFKHVFTVLHEKDRKSVV